MSRAPAPPLHEDIPMKARDMKAWLGLALGMGLLAVTAAASAGDFGDRVDRRMDRKGDRIEHRLDQRGDRIDRRLDHRADRAAAHGHLRKAERLDRKGDRIDRRLDRRGALADARWDRRGDRFNRRWDRHH